MHTETRLQPVQGGLNLVQAIQRARTSSAGQELQPFGLTFTMSTGQVNSFDAAVRSCVQRAEEQQTIRP